MAGLLQLFSVCLEAQTASGKLFIIGGGKRPTSMIERLLQEADLQQGGWGIILPFASEEPDSALWYARKQFSALGIRNVSGLLADTSRALSMAQLDSIRQAKLVYLPGGDQNRLMRLLEKTGARKALLEAYQHGATIAGTSAGAAVMSRHMITGNEKNHPEYHPTFLHLEANNLELAPGLGLLPAHILIDQHFIKRSRYNRLLSAIIEEPSWQGIGIDESTAILVKGQQVEVVGEAQVVVFSKPGSIGEKQQKLLGARNLQLDIYLPGERFSLAPPAKANR